MKILEWKKWPVSGAGLDFIKIMAALLMLIDHIDHIVLERHNFTMFLLGRGAYPLFAYACAAAFIRAGVEKAPDYARNLIMWGLIVVPISWLTRDTTAANILFTLAVGAGVLPFMMAIGRVGRAVIFTAAVVLLYFPNLFEFSFLGALAPVAIYMTMTGTKDGVFWLVISLGLMNFGGVLPEMTDLGGMAYTIMAITSVTTLGVAWGVLRLSQDRPSSEKRLLPKYFLHIFYPAHMIVLALIARFV